MSRPRVAGLITAVRFSEGAVVRRGDVLFQIDAGRFQAEVDRLRADLARANAGLARANTERDRAKRLSSENAIATEEHDRRLSSATEAEAQVAAVAAALRLAELNLEFTQVVAPISGRVGRAIVTEGNLVTSGPGEATLLARLVSLDPIYATFEVDEQSFLSYQRLATASRAARHGRQLGGHPHGAGRRRRIPARRPSAVPRQPGWIRPPERSACARRSPTPTAASRRASSCACA